MSTILNTFSAVPTLHPFYETASAISLLTLRLHGRITLRLAALSAHAFAMASAVIETSAVDPEIMAWGVLNLSLNICMLTGLIRGSAGPSRRATGWNSLIQIGASTLRRLRAGTAAMIEAGTCDRQFF